jgi:zinc transport system substrate-binding protein
MSRILWGIGLVLLLIAGGCHRQEQPAPGGKLLIVTTLFPLYDFAKQLGKDKVDVTLLLPPGVEPHNFEPKPADIVRIHQAGLFVYTDQYMEPWAAKIIGGLDSKKTSIVDSSKGITLLNAGGLAGANHTDEHQRHEGGIDPHIWLDLGNAGQMVDNLLAALVAKDPANKLFYEDNAVTYKKKLQALDERFKSGLADCRQRVFLHGGHYAFGYLARRYGLEYRAAYGVNADAEPTPADLAGLIKQVRSLGLKYVYTEELLNPRVAETIARETGVKLLPLNGAHTIGKEEFNRGTTFVAIMEKNLLYLRMGLQCRNTCCQ